MKTLYKISRGNHSADGLNFGIHKNGAIMSKTVIFHPNCQYDIGNTNQYDINKLYGFSVGLFNSNQYNSARIGWRWSIPKQMIELLAYVYVNGVRINEWDQNISLGFFYTNQPIFTNMYSCIDTITNENQYGFYAGTSIGDKNEIFTPRSGSGSGYNQFPYFGGDEVSPHDMIIELK